MSQKDQQSPRKGRHESTTSISALILSIVCCVGLVHVELKIHHHEQLLNAERVPTIPGEEQRVRTKPTAQGTFHADNNPTVGIQGNILGECLVTARTFAFRFLANFSLGIVFRLMWLIHFGTQYELYCGQTEHQFSRAITAGIRCFIYTSNLQHFCILLAYDH